MSLENRQQKRRMSSQGINLYIHIPFCAQRCIYCDFFTQTNQSQREDFIQALCQEIESRRDELKTRQVANIYFGGGTPSLLTIEELKRIFEVIEHHYDIQEGAEITIECNPDDINEAYVQGLKSLPFNRVSMGVQSFKDEDLKFLNRRHSSEEVFKAVELLKEAGITNLSLDLIYGLPSQSLKEWTYNIKSILSLDIAHISAYHLIYEEGTVLMKRLQEGKVKEVSEEASLAFFQVLIQSLKEAGYEHYEVSNFAKNEAYAKLNTGYWQGMPYLGFGPSAHSYDGKKRSYNIASIKKYNEANLSGRRAFEEEELSLEEQEHEYIMTRLRTMWGINLEEMESLFGAERKEQVLRLSEPYLQSGKLLIEDTHLRLSDEGVFVSDAILVDLFS